MDQTEAKQTLSVLKDYSSAAEEVLYYTEQYDYRDEALKWDDDTIVGCPSLPTLRDLYSRLSRFFEGDTPLGRPYIEAFNNYLEVGGDRLTAEVINIIPIEPIKAVAEEFKRLNLPSEAERLKDIYQFALGVRRWYRSTFQRSLP